MSNLNKNGGAYHLANSDLTKSYQPVRTNNFRFYADFTGLGLIIPSTDTTIDSEDAREILDFSVVKFTPPHFKQGEVEIKRGNSTIYFAGTPTFDTSELVINDYAGPLNLYDETQCTGKNGKSVLLAWQALSYNIAEDYIPSSDKYKIDASVIEYLPDGTYVRHWDLYGCWVQGISEDGWDNESANKKTVQATIRYDRAVPRQDPLVMAAAQ